MLETPLDLLIEDSGSTNGWLSLENSIGLKLGAETFSSSQMTLKRVTVTNPYVPGTYTVRATPDNTTETVAIQLTEEDMASRIEKADYLIHLFTRINYQLMMQMPRNAVIMTGQAADYTVNNQREFLHAGLTVITFSVPILPTKQLVES